jgi:hypothetical protein
MSNAYLSTTLLNYFYTRLLEGGLISMISNLLGRGSDVRFARSRMTLVWGERVRGTTVGSRPLSTVGHTLTGGGSVERGEDGEWTYPPTFYGSAHSHRKRIQEEAKRDERRYPLTLHDWVPYSHQESQERRLNLGKD